MTDNTLAQMQQMQQQMQQQILELHHQLQEARASAPAQAPPLPGPSKPQPFTGRTDGDAVGAFVDAVSQYLDFYGDRMAEPQRVTIATALLHGSAALWYRSYRQRELGGGHSASWNELKHQLLGKFRPINSTETLRDKLYNLGQTTSVARYIEQFNQLLNQLGPTEVAEREALDKFIRGLKKHIRREVRLEAPTSLQAAMETADRVDRLSFDRSTPRQALPRIRHDPMDLGHTEIADITPLSEEERARRLAAGSCFRGGEVGHFSRQCPLRHAESGNGQRRRH